MSASYQVKKHQSYVVPLVPFSKFAISSLQVGRRRRVTEHPLFFCVSGPLFRAVSDHRLISHAVPGLVCYRCDGTCLDRGRPPVLAAPAREPANPAPAASSGWVTRSMTVTVRAGSLPASVSV